jgi:hypothetical protein
VNQFFSIVLLFIITVNCAYLTREPGRPPKVKDVLVPDSLRKIYIQNIQNESYGEPVHLILTRQLKEEIDRRGRFIQTRDKAEARFRLYAAVTHYQKIGNILDSFGQQMSSEISLIVKYEIKEAGSEEKIRLERDEILIRAYYSEQLGYRESEEQAQTRMLKNLAYRVSEEAENAWYHYIKQKYYKSLSEESKP